MDAHTAENWQLPVHGESVPQAVLDSYRWHEGEGAAELAREASGSREYRTAHQSLHSSATLATFCPHLKSLRSSEMRHPTSLNVSGFLPRLDRRRK